MNRPLHPAYSLEFCEREYNVRASLPDYPCIFARWAEQGAVTRRLRACLIDLLYGDTSAEKLDLFPARDDGAPLLVFIHGGYWRSLDKSDFSWLAPPFTVRGVSVALTNYGLAPATSIEDMVRQTLRALAWLYRNADRLGFDPQRMYVAGHSAGAQLAAMMMAAVWPAYGRDLPADLVKGALAVSGLFDLEPLLHAPFVNGDLKLTPQRVTALSPAFMPPATQAPLVTAVGALESSEFRRQTQLLNERWPGNVVQTLDVPACNHLTVVDELANPHGELFAATIDLIRAKTARHTAPSLG